MKCICSICKKEFDRKPALIKRACQLCGEYGQKLVVHHLNGYNWDKENRYNVDNGVTLCEKCHKAFHKIYRNGNNTKEQYIEYANQNRRLD